MTPNDFIYFAFEMPMFGFLIGISISMFKDWWLS